MNAIHDHIYALKRTFQLLFKGHFWEYFIPGIVLTILFYLLGGGFSWVGGKFLLLEKIPFIGSYIGWFLNTLFGWVSSFSLFIYQFIIITLFSPFNTALSQKLDEIETGQKFEMNFDIFMRDFLRLLGIVFLGGFMYWGALLVFWIFAKIIGLSFIFNFISIILLGFFTGFNSYDYPLERYGIRVGKSWGFAFKHPLHMLLTGGIFTLLLYIPIIGFIIAPIVLTMTGTLIYIKMRERGEAK